MSKRFGITCLRTSLLSLACAVSSLVFAGCRRERRDLHELPAMASAASGISVSGLHPGQSSTGSDAGNPYEESAYTVSEGQRLFDWYNCSGCHSHGGGGIGPPLMDNRWIYGSEPANIYHTIVEGRPNGMPSFRGKIPEYQVWELAAFVRSMSGLLPKDVAPSRTDHMWIKFSEAQTPPQHPVKDQPSKKPPKEKQK